MNTWKLDKWKSIAFSESGIRLRFESSVDPEVKRALTELTVWLRKEYIFPAKVIVYIKSAEKIRAMNDEMVFGTCFRPGDMSKFPHIKIATGDYPDLLSECGKDNALAAILNCYLQMLTNYFQWVNELDELTEEEEDRDAARCAGIVMCRYKRTREHP